MEYVIIFGAIVFLGVLFSWRVSAHGRIFVIRLRNGVPFLVRGKVAQAFVVEIADVLNRHGVRRGAIKGYKRAGRVSLGFSRAIPQGCRQSLRNVWAMHSGK